MKRFIFLLFVFLLACSGGKVREEKSSREIKNLEDFFARSELDARNAASVIVKHRIIQHLTHLRRMNGGGKKYYLLERDSITEMINSVTRGIYLDYVLINRHGNVVYTRNNDELFGQNVNEGFEKTPLKNCFSNRNSFYINDVAAVSTSSSVYSLYMSIPVYVEGSFHGILILLIDISRISELVGPGTELVSADGTVRVSSDRRRIMSSFEDFEKIRETCTGADCSGTVKSRNRNYFFRSFRYKNIFWFVLKKKV